MNKHNLTEENYFSTESSLMYSGSSQIKDFIGCPAKKGCPARALASIRGEYKEEPSTALILGSYVDEAITGDLDLFKAKNPQLFKKDGTLKAVYEKGNKMVLALERQPLAMKFLTGGKQEILVGDIEGLPLKVKMDVVNRIKKKIVAITDLKTTEDMFKTHYVQDYGRINWIEYWNYYQQLLQYREIVRQNYEGLPDDLPVYLVAVDKKNEPCVKVIQLNEHKLQMEWDQLRANCRAVKEYKEGIREPERCGECDYCRSTEIITEVSWSEDIGFL